MGYIPSANQSGRFLNRNQWSFNNRHMGVQRDWDASLRPNILLLGNSIVLGGNPFDQSDKIGPQLERALGGKFFVWPVAAGGWTNLNEEAYLRQNSDVMMATDILIWEYMIGGATTAAVWQGSYAFPPDRPWVVSAYAFRRYIMPRISRSLGDYGQLPPLIADDPTKLRGFVERISGTAPSGLVMLLLYPTIRNLKGDEREPWAAEVRALKAACAERGIVVIDLSEEPDWTDKFYLSDGVHLTVPGNHMVAKILANHVASSYRPLLGEK